MTKVGDQFLHKRQSSGSALDIFPVNDDHVLECIVALDPAPGQAPPRFGQKVRIKPEAIRPKEKAKRKARAGLPFYFSFCRQQSVSPKSGTEPNAIRVETASPLPCIPPK